MNDYYDKSMRALQLAGMSKRTQQCYTRSVRMLVDFYGKTPDLNVLRSGHGNILKKRQKISKNTSISVLIDQFSCKNWPIKGGGGLRILTLDPELVDGLIP